MQIVKEHIAEPAAEATRQKIAPPMMKSDTLSAGMSQ